MSFATVTGVALVTGAAVGIGRETGYAFAEAGALVVVFADLNLEGATASAENSKKFAANPKYQHAALKVDVSDAESVQAMVGATSLAPTSDINVTNFDQTLAVNTRGTMLCRHGDERTLGRGSIVHIASSASYIAAPGMMAYVASKHAVMGITKVAAPNPRKCLVSDLGRNFHARSSLGRWKGLEQVIQKASPAGRPATPEEVANVAVFLCSPSASYINGAGLLIDAGMTVTAHL
ncbi:hypothetical protein EAF04_003004 [Stromatinia cepivora]|nr:hypothetical protein EAF04_003004 [Stromatinia cepivora]